MEVERVVDGPLKNSEIIRFLEASKTSYKAIDNILTDKKEPIFHQRTLLEIAAETKNRIETPSITSSVESSEAQESEIENPENVESQETKSVTVEEENETIRLNEIKKEEERLAKEEKEKEIFERGFSEGKSAAELETKTNVENGLIALENARQSILDLNASHFIKLRDQIVEKILTLASERAGSQIEGLPEKFFTKIETLLETIGQTTQSPKVYLNLNDLESIKTIIQNKEKELSVSFAHDEKLSNGDIIIEMGSISVRDIASERSHGLSTEEGSKNSEEDEKIRTKVNPKDVSSELSELNEKNGLEKKYQGDES